MLRLASLPQRLECFDISHTAGEGTVASCVVFGPEGPIKKEYRRFNIAGVTPGDDYGALRQALKRRYERVKAGEVPAPDVLFIDGGQGQINEVHGELGRARLRALKLVGVAKGPDRRVGQERLIIHDAGTDRARAGFAARCGWSSASATRRIVSRSPGIASAARAATTNPCWRPFPAWVRRSAARCSSTSAAYRD